MEPLDTSRPRSLNEAHDDQPEQLPFIRRLVDENVDIAGYAVEISAGTWAIHGVIPVDGNVIVAEFDTYDEARTVLDAIPLGSRRSAIRRASVTDRRTGPFPAVP